MLRALNELGGLGLTDAALAGYAARLGSDCAFFVYCRPMFATGRGEVLDPFDIDLSGYEIRVELPLDAATGCPVAVSTREAYSGIVPRDLQGVNCQGDTHFCVLQKGQSVLSKHQIINNIEITLPLREALLLPIEQWRGLVVNDFEATVCPLHPEIPALIEDFYRRGAVYAAMSGSGSAVFGLFHRR